ncbi:MAG: cytochrome c biogenesis protein ResB, partial [Microbacterium sp.]|uniref:cytochrome c biogenesis protein ResB n=1 Tax=Microbacterium sp. TaxID=51671 RepID=UPI0026040FB5
MSHLRSDTPAEADPLRPSDHVDGDGAGASDDGVTSPRLGFIGWVRWGWRQLTSMRTALVLLLLLAIAAVPGSIFPQRTADPNGVTQFKAENPDLFPILDGMQLFDVYASAWFSAIYILLFISLIGCVIPRTQHHWKALRTRPPRTPARLSRLEHHSAVTVPLAPGTDADAAAETAIAAAQKQLRSSGYRVERYDGTGTRSVSAERGYLRETGNLLFHISLVGVLLAVGIGGAYTYTGQRAIIEGTSFTNALTFYSSFNPGRLVDGDTLTPYSVNLEKFDVSYVPYGEVGSGQAGDFVAHVATTRPGEDAVDGEVRVNHPLDVGADRIYLMGNGYAPTITVRDPDGTVVFHDSVAFLPQTANMTSLGVVKVTDGLADQLGLIGFFYPTMAELKTGALTSIYPDLVVPMLTLNVYAGDLGIDDGTARSVYTLDPTGMEQLTGGETGVDSIQLMPGETTDLPNGLGTVTFEDATPADADANAADGDYSQSVKRYVSLSIHHDVAAPFVLLFAVLALAGLLLALFVPRRRMWVKVAARDGKLRIEYAGLARGEDPTLAAALAQLTERHAQALRAEPDVFLSASAPSAPAEAAPASSDSTPGAPASPTPGR